MIKTPHQNLNINLIIGVAIIAAIVISACEGPSLDLSGLDTISPDGRWATIFDDESDSLFLMDLQSPKNEPILIADKYDSLISSNFSADSRYLLFYTGNNWQLYEISTNSFQELDEAESWVQFLPGDELLVISPAEVLGQFSIIRDLENLQATELLLENVQQGFTNSYLITKLPGPGFFSFQGCPANSAVNPIVWVLVDTSGEVYSLVSEVGKSASLNRLPADSASVLKEFLVNIEFWRINIEEDGVVQLSKSLTSGQLPLPSGLADSLKVLVGLPEIGPYDALLHINADNEITVIVDTAEGPSPRGVSTTLANQLLEWINQQTWNNEGFLTQISSAEIDFLFGSFQQRVLPSPDGTKLLFLHLKDDEPGYFLELINLSTGASEPVSLVEGSEWIPSYNFSPDGQMIVFESNLQLANNSETNGSVNNGHYLYQANSDGSNISQLDNAQEIVRSCWH